MQRVLRELHRFVLNIKYKVGWQQEVGGGSMGLMGCINFAFYLKISGGLLLHFIVGIYAQMVNVKLNEFSQTDTSL